MCMSPMYFENNDEANAHVLGFGIVGSGVSEPKGHPR